MTRYILFAIISTVFVLLAWLLSPALAALSLLTGPKLPLGLQWFGTVDADLDGGQHQHADKYPSGVTGWRLWWQRTTWICRNPAQGFQTYLLGYDARGYFLVFDETKEGARTRVWRRLGYGQIFSYQTGGAWFGWAFKPGINRFSLKFIPFGSGK